MFTTTVLLQSTTSDLRFAVTNVYGSADHSHIDLFLNDLHDIAAVISNPAWILIRDLNLTHYPPRPRRQEHTNV